MKSQSFGNLWDRALLPHSRASPPLLPMAASLLWTHTGVGGSDYRPETQCSRNEHFCPVRVGWLWQKDSVPSHLVLVTQLGSQKQGGRHPSG